MKRKGFILYLLIGGILVLAALTVYFYQEYLGEDLTQSLKNGQNPIIAQPVNGVVTQTAVNTVDQQQKLDVTYTDIESNEASHFTVNADHGQRIHPGDTITKGKGEKMLMVNQKDGEIEMVPID